jgi:mono/diheme cytochrome c family protein
VTKAGGPDEPEGSETRPTPESEAISDDLASAVPGRVSELDDREESRTAPVLKPSVWAIVLLGGVVIAVAALVLFLLTAGGPAPSAQELSRRPLNPKPGGPPAGLAASGKPIYEANCASCHGAAGDGGVGPGLRARRVALAPDSVLATIVERGLGTMPAIHLSSSDEQALLAYVRYLEGLPAR